MINIGIQEYLFHIKKPIARLDDETEPKYTPTTYFIGVIIGIILAIIIVSIINLPNDITTFGIALCSVIIGYTTAKMRGHDPRYINFLAAVGLVIAAIVFWVISPLYNYLLLIIIAAEITGITL